MNIGAFSLSLTVKDIKKSQEFYKKLGFDDFGGDITQNWLIMKNEDWKAFAGSPYWGTVTGKEGES